MSQAIEDVIAERRRQVEVEGWTSEHDDEHYAGDLAKAAACYALYSAGVYHTSNALPRHWPWKHEWWKPKDKRSDLVRAAALIIAEIERLDRSKP